MHLRKSINSVYLNLDFDDFAAKFIYLRQPMPSVFADFALTNVNFHALLRFNIRLLLPQLSGFPYEHLAFSSSAW
jgi:hypothetical protein